MSTVNAFRFATISLIAIGLILTSCKKKKEEEAMPESSFRGTSIDYNLFNDTTLYNNDLFKDKNGDSTVDRTDGQALLRMINVLNTELRKATAQQVDDNVLTNIYNNTGSVFTGGNADLNSYPLSISDITATSKSNQSEVQSDFTSWFTSLEYASTSYAVTAGNNLAGVLVNGSSKYLVDTNGIELVQLIQKASIGGVQMDYIGNYLLDEGLNANNTQLVSGKKYTELEHNWDIAYGLFSLNKSLYKGYTDAAAPVSGGPIPRESLLASYVWEYNKDAYKKMNKAFLIGRAAIMNGDMNEVRAQASFIRKSMELAIAAAGVGYLKKWTDNSASTPADDAIRAHAIGEGAGFIYSLRFCYENGSNDAFSDTQLTNLGLFTGNGFWDLSTPVINPVSTAIKNKFGLQ